jgi:hypothetical protein
MCQDQQDSPQGRASVPANQGRQGRLPHPKPRPCGGGEGIWGIALPSQGRGDLVASV